LAIFSEAAYGGGAWGMSPLPLETLRAQT